MTPLAWEFLPTASLISGFAVIAIAGFFTVRSNIAQTWKDNYQAERTARLAAEDEAKRQRQLKHEAVNELQALRLKTDLTPLMQFASDLREEVTRERAESERRIVAELDKLARAIRQQRQTGR